MPEPKHDCLRAAIFYATNFRWKVLPLGATTKRPMLKGGRGVYDASSDPATIRSWFADHPKSSVGIACGLSGLLILDVDPRNGGEESLERLVSHALGVDSVRLVDDLDTPLVLTGGGGRHYYFRAPTGGFSKAAVGTKFRELYPGLDLISDGGYVVAPPSPHVSGNRYEWEAESLPTTLELRDFPSWLAAAARLGTEAGERTRQPFPEGIVPEGARNETLFKIACAMRRPGLSSGEILPALRAYNQEHCVPPLPESELASIAKKVDRYRPGAPVSPETPTNGKPDEEIEELAEQVTNLSQTDLGNVQRLVVRHGEEFRFCPSLGRFLVWEDGRWRADDSGAVLRFAIDTVEQMHLEAAGLKPKAKTGLQKHATRSESRSRLEAMVALARYQNGIVVPHERLDQHHYAFVAKNGVVDLRTGTLRDHDPSLLLTRRSPVSFDPQAKAPRWESFLDDTFEGDRELIDFVQRAVGYGLSGQTNERAFFILYGIGRNGKSTFLTALEHILGDYYETTPADTLLTKKYDGPTNDIARLRGARFVVAFESDEGRRLAEGLVKQMTGGDPITARFLHSEFFTYRPTFKIFLVTNHKPEVRGTDVGIWDRIRLIPFLYQVPEDRKDLALGEKLKDEAEGILAWAVRGAIAWASEGLGTSEKVSMATSNYQDSQDKIQAFLDDVCEVLATAVVKSSDLYKAYRDWSEANGERPIGQSKLGEKLAEKGFVNEKGAKGVRYWVGLQLARPAGQTDLPV